MCGWRKYMEDAHIAKPTFVQNMSLFAVFDGHGGG
jgi:serine/threonine protein phosphatase PrpC